MWHDHICFRKMISGHSVVNRYKVNQSKSDFKPFFFFPFPVFLPQSSRVINRFENDILSFIFKDRLSSDTCIMVVCLKMREEYSDPSRCVKRQFSILNPLLLLFRITRPSEALLPGLYQGSPSYCCNSQWFGG